jgi:hypothetical protein
MLSRKRRQHSIAAINLIAYPEVLGFNSNLLQLLFFHEILEQFAF